MTFAGIPFWAVVGLMAGCIGIVTVLHLLRIRPREIRVITTLFWGHEVKRTRARTLLHRFHHPWTYALLLLIAALLILALGRPQRIGEPADRVHEVIVLDTGVSMTASDAVSNGSRFDAARQVVLAETNRLSLDDRVAVIVVDPWPRVIHGFGDPRPWVRLRLSELTPADQPAARPEALKLAQSLLRGKTNARVVMVTDRPFAEPLFADSRSAAPVNVVRVGDAVSNAAVVSAMFEPDADDPLRGRFHVRVAYWGEQPREVTVRVRRAGGAPLLSESARIASGQASDFTLADVPADGDTLIVELSPDDAVKADNRAVYRIPLRTPIRVSVGESVPLALRLAVQSDPAVRIVDEGQDRDVAVLVEGELPSADVPTVAVIESGPEGPAGREIRAASGSPLMEGLNFEGATCGTGVVLSEAHKETQRTSPGRVGHNEPLLTVGDAVLASLLTQPGARGLHLGSALMAGDSDAPRHAAFAVFLSRAIRFLAGWESDPVVLTPERMVADPLWADESGVNGEVLAMPASRASADLSMPASTEEPTAASDRRRWAVPALFELVLFLAVACFLVEATLHARGRIP